MGPPHFAHPPQRLVADAGLGFARCFVSCATGTRSLKGHGPLEASQVSGGSVETTAIDTVERFGGGDVRYLPRMSTEPGELIIKVGGKEDVEILLALFDEAVAWMVSRGQTGQWGSAPFSSRPAGIAQARRLAAEGGLRIGRIGGEPVAALALGDAPQYAPPSDRSELYILLLLTARRKAGQRLGDRLIQRAVAEARHSGCEQLRVDCWAGAPRLIAWYEHQGFTRAGTFDHSGWNGQVFKMMLA